MKRKSLVCFLLAAAFTSTFAPSAFASDECPHSPGYWKTRREGSTDYWVGMGIVFAGLPWGGMFLEGGGPGDWLTDEEAMDVLWMNKRTGDASVYLASQIIAVMLNVEVCGLTLTMPMRLAVADGVWGLWVAGGIGTDPSEPLLRYNLLIYAELFDYWNNGNWGEFPPPVPP